MRKGKDMSEEEVGLIWKESVRLLRMGVETGRIICVTKEEQARYKMGSRRRGTGQIQDGIAPQICIQSERMLRVWG
eukprot:g62185.t1